MRSQIDDPRRVFGLDLMRCAAITMVFVGHALWLFPQSETTMSLLLQLASFLGVEVFFVLSGFLIGRILYRIYVAETIRTSDIKTFLKRRWYRTLPNYYLILCINFLIAFFIGYEVQGAWKYFFFLQNFAAPLLPFFPESWSLSVEEFAYLILPLALFAAAAVARTNRRWMFLIVAMLLTAACVLLKMRYHYLNGITALADWNIGLKSVVVYRLDAIFIGVIFAWIYMNHHVLWKRFRILLMVAGFFVMGFLGVGVGYFGLFIERVPFFWNVLYLPVTSLGISFFLPVLSEWKTQANWVRRPITFISLISYSIYLLHYSIVMQLLKRLGDTAHMNPPQIAMMAISYITLTISLSYLLYRYFEKPMMDLRNSR